MTAPSIPSVCAKTKKKYYRGYTVNGVHYPRWINIDLRLNLVCIAYRVCHECHREIKRGEIWGYEFMTGADYCTDCMDMPDVLIWSVEYRMKRKSKQNPDGIKHETLIGTQEVAEEYANALSTSLGRDVKLIRQGA